MEKTNIKVENEKNSLPSDIFCDAVVSYVWGDHNLERQCKKKAKYSMEVRMKHNGHTFTRSVCQSHKNQIDQQQKYDGYSSEIISVKNISKLQHK